MQVSETVNTIGNHRIVQRAIGLASFRVPALVTIARDRAATAEAAIVVGVVALANTLGNGPDSFHQFAFSLVLGFLSWIIFTALTFFMSTNIFGTPTTNATIETLVRTLGYARGPAVLALFGFFPILGGIVSGFGVIWAFVVAIFAVRYTLGLSTGRALITVLVATGVTSVITAILGFILGIGFNVTF